MERRLERSELEEMFSRREALILDMSFWGRAVARMGSVVVRRRCRVRAKPMPREEGQMKIQGEVMMDKYGVLASISKVTLELGIW